MESGSKEDVEKVIQLCSFKSSTPASTSEVIGRLTPAVQLLEQSTRTVPSVQASVASTIVGALPHLSASWTTSDSGDAQQLQQSTLALCRSLCSIVQSPSIAADVRSQLSAAVRDLLVAALRSILPAAGGTGTAPPMALPTQRRSPVHLFLRALMSSSRTSVGSGAVAVATASSSGLAAADAVGGLDGSSGSSRNMTLPLSADDALVLLEWCCENCLRRPAAAALHPLRLDQDLPIVLVTQLVRLVAEEASDRPAAATSKRKALKALAEWVHSTFNGVLAQMRGRKPTKESTDIPTGPVLRAAAGLGAAVVCGMAPAASATKAPPPTDSNEPLATALLDVAVEFVEEALLAVRDECSSDAPADGVLSVAASVMEELTPVMAVAASATAADGRFFSLLVRLRETVRTTATMLPTSSAAPGVVPSRSNGAIQSMPATANGAANGPTASPSLTAWDISKPLGHSRVVGKVVGAGAQHLCCATAEVLSSGLAAAWMAGERAFAMSIVSPTATGRSVSEQEVMTMVLGRLFLLADCDAAAAELLMPLLMDALVSGQPIGAEPRVQAALVKTLAAMAAGAVAGRQSADWAYHQVVELLLRMYREPVGGATALLAVPAGGTSTSSSVLAQAVLTLAQGMQSGSRPLRRDLRTRLLTLFNDLGLRVGSPTRPNLANEMGALLPAIAAACTELEPFLSHSSSGSSRFSYGDIQSAQKGNGHVIKLLRSFWLYVALMGFSTKSAPEAWQVAAGRVASVTPLLLVPLGTSSDMDDVERLKMTFGVRLAHAGALANPAKLHSTLMALLGPLAPQDSSVAPPAASGSTTAPPKLVHQAYLLAVATCELARSGHGPLPEPEEVSPIAIPLAYVQTCHSHVGAGPGSSATAVADASAVWLVAIAKCAFNAYLKHLAIVKAAVATPAERGAAASVDSCYEGLAVSLIDHMSTNGSELGSPRVSQLSNELLTELLRYVPRLYWNRRCMQALIDSLELEESDRPMGAARAAVDNAPAIHPVWALLRQWVEAAAGAAPARAEALVHAVLGSTCRGGWHGRSASHAAATRHAPDLLAICAKQRRGPGGRSAAQDAGEGTLALCRKQYYAGIVSGMQLAGDAGETSSSAAAMQVVNALDNALKHHLTTRVVEDHLLSAAALLAGTGDQLASDDVLLSSDATSALLKRLASVPVSRFGPEMMKTALFAWNWVAASAPQLLVPLVAHIATAWCRSVDLGLGMFCSAGDGSGAETDPSAVPKVVMTSDGQAEPTLGSGHEASLVTGALTHQAWLRFFAELQASMGVHSAADEHATLIEILSRLLHYSLHDPSRLCGHPTAAGARFSLLALALRHSREALRISAPHGGAPTAPESISLLLGKVVRGGLAWFYKPAAWSALLTHRQAAEEVAALGDFIGLLERVEDWPKLGAEAATSNGGAAAPQEHPLWGRVSGEGPPDLAAAARLLSFLCRYELDRLQVWSEPLHTSNGPPPLTMSKLEWKAAMRVAWQVTPQLAVSIAQRFPTAKPAADELQRLLQKHANEPQVQAIPQAAMLLASDKAAAAKLPCLDALATWAPAGAAEGLELISGAGVKHAGIKAYAIRCLENTDPVKVAFFLSQLVQSLRYDSDGRVQEFFLKTAQQSDMFAHQLIWALQTEEKPPEEAFHPEVKRSGWQAPRDYGLWKVSATVLQRVLEQLDADSRAFWEAESGYFNQVNRISGILKKYDKDERRIHVKEELDKFTVPRDDLYVPTNPDCKVKRHIPSSGTPMQSAAKVPILVAFEVEQQQPEPMPPLQRTLACIFKVGDDCRQDVLALQVVHMLHSAFKRAGLDVYLCPYGVLPNGYECGIVECVPNTKSRAAMGELSDNGLVDIYQAEWGAPGSPGFEAARRNFIISEAGYAISSFILQAKDRHNGNLLIDADGHLVHIDFGFILEISPGGNMGFESAAFKLSHEMTQLLDPGGQKTSPHFLMFEELVVRGYLAARTVAEPIIATVALMAESGLPCFGRGAPIANLRKRFHLEMTDRQAAQFIRAVLADAYAKWTTGVYDYIQSLQNRIPY